MEDKSLILSSLPATTTSTTTTSSAKICIDYFNNAILLKPNKLIDQNDVEFITLYFETIKYDCGGYGEIIGYKYNESANYLMIRCLQNNVRQEILKRKYFKYEHYEFEAISVEKKSLFEKNKSHLILQNISQELDLDRIKMYLKYLDPQNTVLKVEFSSVYKDSLYAKFEHEINLEKVKLRLSMRSTLCNRAINLYEVYNTNSLLVKLNTKNKKVDDLYVFLGNNFRVKDVCYWQSVGNLTDLPFIIIQFNKLVMKETFLQNYKVDNVYIEYIENIFNENLNLNSVIHQNFEDIKNSEQASDKTCCDKEAATHDVNTESLPTTSNSIAFDNNPPLSKASISILRRKLIKNKDKYNALTRSIDKSIKTNYATDRAQKIYYCQQCPYRSLKINRFNDHKACHDNEGENYKCKFCSFNAKSLNNHMKHEKLHVITKFKSETNL